MEMGNPLWFAEEWWAKDVTALVLTLNDRVLNDEQRKEVIMLLLRREKKGWNDWLISDGILCDFGAVNQTMCALFLLKNINLFAFYII